jgi:hypothetical protein
VGDFYLDTAAHALYGPKTAGGWGSSTNLVGPQGIQGIQGPQGPQGIPGTSPTLSATTESDSFSVPDQNAAQLIVVCPSGDVATGGGGGFPTPAAAGLVIQQSQPLLSGTTPIGWQMVVVNTSGSTATFNIYQICMPTSANSGAVPATGAAQPKPTIQLWPIKP